MQILSCFGQAKQNLSYYDINFGLTGAWKFDCITEIPKNDENQMPMEALDKSTTLDEGEYSLFLPHFLSDNFTC